jgi:hypothetical protein
MESGASGYDIFDAIAGAPGTYISYDIHGNLQWGFSVSKWQDWVAQNYTSTGYAFTGGNGSIFESQKEIAAIQFGQLACSGQSSSAVAGCIQQVYDQLPSSSSGVGLEGGNYDFTYGNIQINGQSFNPIDDFGCARCGAFNTLDFSHRDGTFHVDTANPWFVPFGSVAHLAVDIIGGNTWWRGGIPRTP